MKVLKEVDENIEIVFMNVGESGRNSIQIGLEWFLIGKSIMISVFVFKNKIIQHSFPC